VEQRDLLKRYLDAGMAFTTMTRSRAEAIVKELARAGEVQREQVQAQVDDLVQRSRHNTDQLRTLVRKEVESQFSGLGLATKRDLSALERRLTERFGGATKATPAKKTPAKKAATRKAAAKKAAVTRAAKTVATGNRTGGSVGLNEPSVSQAPAKDVQSDQPLMNEAPGNEAQAPQVSDS
jgi:polyhydroxyalkanoate synthesis regulator phasin